MRGLQKIIRGEIKLWPVWQQFVYLLYQFNGWTLGCKNMFIENVIKSRKREEWLGKLLPAATYLRRFSPLLNWTCLQTLMSSPPNWCLFKHAMAFCLAQHSGASLSSWNGIQSKCFEGTCLFNLANHNEKDKCLSSSSFYGITSPHQAHCYLCN